LIIHFNIPFAIEFLNSTAQEHGGCLVFIIPESNKGVPVTGDYSSNSLTLHI